MTRGEEKHFRFSVMPLACALSTNGSWSCFGPGAVRHAPEFAAMVKCDIIIRMVTIYWTLVPYYVSDTMLVASHLLK